MSRYTLTIVDTTGIQDYIFGTNNLQQNVGASYLVECATRKWVVEALRGSSNVHNVIDLDSETPFTDQAIEDGMLQAEVVYAGGGNTVILFASHELAVEFARRLTCRVLQEAPGLQVILVHEDFDWQTHPLGGEAGIVAAAMTRLAVRKADPPVTSALLGLGVTAACAFTGLPAVAENVVNESKERRLISAEVEAKLEVQHAAHSRLTQLVNFHNYFIPKDFDDFGRTKGESSYIAVIHTDGNGMGKRIERLRDKFPTSDKNREYLRAMRAFSVSVQNAARKALQGTVDRLIASIQEVDEKLKIGGVIEVQENRLPFRPIVFGGDDVTFVCDGRLGLTLTAAYLEQFSSIPLSDENPAHCRAGVAVVKTHYPFARAYALADALCQSAKRYIKERQQPQSNEDNLTAMDWHFATSGLILGLQAVREREYTVLNEGSLCMRPVQLTNPEQDWRSWEIFSQIVREFCVGEQWAERRNKVKAFRDVLRTGRKAVEHFRTVYGLDKLPPIPQQPEMEVQGWQGDRCGYFDAIEAMDFFVPLAER